MTPDLRDYARLVLRHEPTRSLPLGVLRERLRQAAGDRWPGAQRLEQAFDTDPAFRLLRPPPLIETGGGGYSPELLAAGFPQPEPRVLLVEDSPPPEDRPQLFGNTSDALLVLLAHDGMRSEVAEAIAALEEIGAQLREQPVLSPAAAARSTTPPPGPAHRAPGRQGSRRPASRRPLRPEPRRG